MAITPDTYEEYVGDGINDLFDITFSFDEQDEIFVSVDGVDVLYSFFDADTVQTAVAPALNSIVRVYRNVDATAIPHKFVDGVPFRKEFVDANNNLLIKAIQEVNNNMADVVEFQPRTVRVPTGETIPDLPDAAGRANRLLGFDNNGDPIATGGTDVLGPGNYIDLIPQSTPPAHTEGRVYYDEEERALSYYNNESGVTINLGQELVVRVRNASGAAITDGSVVAVTGTTGQTPTITLAQADVDVDSRVIGVVTQSSIANNDFGYVTANGNVNDIDTSAFNDGDIVFLSDTPGQMTTVPPAYPSRSVAIGLVLSAHASQGKLLVGPHFINDRYAVGSVNFSNGTGRAEEDPNFTYDDNTETLTVTRINSSTTQRIYPSVADAMVANNSAYDRISTHSYHPGWVASVAGPKGAANYHRDGTTGTPISMYADRSGFYDQNGDGFRIQGSSINAHQFGAVGDGVTDDTAAIQSVLNYCSSIGATLWFPNGEYIVSSLTYTPSAQQRSINIIGQGALRPNEPENNLAAARARGVILHFKSISGSDVGLTIGNGLVSPQGVYIENIYLLGKTQQNVASPTDTTVGLKLDLCPEAVLRNVTCSKFNTPIDINNCWSSSLYNCAGVRCYKSIRFGAGSNAIKLYSWKSHTSYWAGEVTAESAGITFYSPWFESLENGFVVNNPSQEVSGLMFVNPHCESITNYCFELGYDLTGTPTAGVIQSVHIIGGYYDSVGSGVGNAKLRVADSVTRDLLIHGEMGNFAESQVVGNFAPLNIIRTKRVDAVNSGGPYVQRFIGYATGVPDNTLTEIVYITVPVGDCNFAVNVKATGNSPLGSFSAMTEGVISIVRKSGQSECYATFTETVPKVAVDNGSGQSYGGVFQLSIIVVQNVVRVRITADNNQSQTNQIMTQFESLGGERSQGSVRQLTFENV